MLDEAAATNRDAGWAQGAILAVIPALLIMNAMAVVPIIPRLHVVFSHEPDSEMLVSMVAVAPTLGIAFASLAAALGGGRIDRRRLLEAGTALFAVTAVLPFWLDSLFSILTARALSGVGLGLMVVAGMHLTADYFSGAVRQRWLGIQHAASSATAMIALVIVGALGELSWRYPFLLMLAALPYLATLFFVKPRPDVIGVESATHAEGAAGEVPWAKLIVLMLLTIISSLIVFAPLFEIGLVYQERGLGGAALTGLTASILAIGSIVGSLSFSRFARFSPFAKLALVYAIATPGTFLVGSAGQAPGVMCGAFLVGFGQGLLLPVVQGWLLDLAPEQSRTRLVGVFNLLFFLTNFAMPLVARSVALASGGAARGMVSYTGAGCVILAGLLAASIAAAALGPRRSVSRVRAGVA